MTKRSKRILFYSAVAVFLLLSYVIILYAQGYKYSFSEGKFLRTGAISLKANTSAKVFINDEFQGETSFFSNSFSVDQLLPGKYKLSVQKDNYTSWQKTVTVEEGLVVDFSQILLLPKDGDKQQELLSEVDLLFKNLEPMQTVKPTPALANKSAKSLSSTSQDKPLPTPKLIQGDFALNEKTGRLYRDNGQQLEEIATGVKGFRLSENENKITWWTNNEIWVIWLSDQNYQPFYKKSDKELITRLAQSIQNVAWFRGEDHLILELEAHDSKNRPYSTYKVIEIDKRGEINVAEI